MAEDRTTAALRPSSKEIDAQKIEIECVEPPGGKAGGYIVIVTPKATTKKEKEKPWDMKCIKRVFETESATLAYLKKIL